MPIAPKSPYRKPDSEPLRNTINTLFISTYRKIARGTFPYLIRRFFAVAIIGAFASFFSVQPAHAGLLSFLGNLFGAEQDVVIYATSAQPADAVSLQSLPLLSAPTNADTRASRGGAVLNVVQESALLPVVGPLGSIADIEEQELKTDRISLYTVREGDNISVVARMFGVSVNTIIWANDIKRGHVIQPGDVLVILPVSGIKHEVQKGDTLASIAKKYKADIGDILAFNNLALNDTLTAGQEVIIPDGELAAPPAPTQKGTRAIARAGGPDVSGYFTRPIVGGKKSQGIHGYNGVDLAGSCGDAVYASAAGTVIVARSYGWNGGYGNYVVISHANGTQTLYAHNTTVQVASGQYVTQGQVIGTIGSTGRSTGCHVHFEVRGAKNPF